MKTKNKIIEIKSKEQLDIVDLTDNIISFVEESGVKNGLINIQTLHTTASIFIQEKEPLLLKDIKTHLEKIAPQDINYKHDGFGADECRNGHSHCKAIRLPTSITLNLIDGQIQLGTWQKILFIELDKARDRKVQIQILGE